MRPYNNQKVQATGGLRGTMVRMLHIVGSMSPSGIGNFIMNIYRNIDRSRVQFDFIVHEKREVSFDEEIQKLGGRLFYVTRKSVNPVNNFLEMRKVVKEGNYRIVFRHTDTATVALDLLAAKLGGAGRRIPHSHSTGTSGVKMHKLFQPFLNWVSTDYFACSEQAGKWLYGHNQFEVVLNGIDAESFAFSDQTREEVRKQEGVEGKLIFGHVGNFLPVKNHAFMLEVFSCIKKQCKEAVLMLVGDGALHADIEKKAEELHIQDALILCGVRNDTSRLLQAMDLFFFPSFYEGMPIALVEAQAAGLPCLVSEAVTEDVIITNLVTKMQIPQKRAEDEKWTEDSKKAMAEKWAVKAVKLAHETMRTTTTEQIRQSGFAVEHLAKRYERLAAEIEKD